HARARRLAAAGGQKPQTDTFAQLAGRGVGEGDREDPGGGDAILGDGPHVALDEHARLAAAGARGERERAAAPRNRLLLLVGELAQLAHRASQRQIAGKRQPPPGVQVAGRGSSAPLESSPAATSAAASCASISSRSASGARRSFSNSGAVGSTSARIAPRGRSSAVRSG